MSSVQRIELPDPKIGSKGYLINRKGRFLFEDEPSVLRTLACTGAGAGGFTVYDGIPNQHGFFPQSEQDAYLANGRWKYDKRWSEEDDLRNGRIIFKANPAILGSWMFDVQAHHGLNVFAEGGNESALTFATVSWMRAKRGNKSFFLDRKGTFCLEKGATAFKGIAITHGGSGSIRVYDGIPNENGFFPDERMPESDPNYWVRNGRPIFEAHPPWVQMWFPDAGCLHGLTVRSEGGHAGSNAMATLVWQKK